MEKLCTKCSINKNISEFTKDKNRKGGVRPECKACCRKRVSPHIYEEKQRLKNGLKTCTGKYGCGKIKPLKDFGKSCISKTGYAYTCKYCANKSRKAADKKRKRPKITEKKCTGKYGCGIIKKIDDFDYRKDSKRFMAYCKECRVKKFHSNINAKLAAALRGRVRTAVRGKAKSSKLLDQYLGCSYIELKEYLERMFYYSEKRGEMMCWENWSYTGWHIDHIVPLASFDLNDTIQLKKACHYTNLQPLWAEENFSKNAKIGAKYDNQIR